MGVLTGLSLAADRPLMSMRAVKLLCAVAALVAVPLALLLVFAQASARQHASNWLPEDTGAHVVVHKADPGQGTESLPRLEVLRLLRRREFSRLTAVIDSRQALVERDVRSEVELARIVEAFGTTDPSVSEALDAWVAAMPDSFAPYVARARHRFQLAFSARGTEVAAKTSTDQFEAMSQQLVGVVSDALAALERDPLLTEAYALLIGAARTIGDQLACDAVGERGLSKAPASLRIRTALAVCALPKWGGSQEQVEGVARDAEPHIASNPGLAALRGFWDWELGRGADEADELVYYDRAIDAGGHWFFYRDRAEALVRHERFDDALTDAESGLALMPDEPALLVWQLQALHALARFSEAAKVAATLTELEPSNERLAEFKSYESEAGPYDGAQLVQAQDLKRAIERLSFTIDVVGGTVEAHYWRGRAHLKSGADDAALKDFEQAVALDSGHLESYRNINYILGGRSEWARLVAHWNAYLARKPDDADALFERARAHHKAGDQTAALRDARAACDRGNRVGCSAASRQ